MTRDFFISLQPVAYFQNSSQLKVKAIQKKMFNFVPLFFSLFFQISNSCKLSICRHCSGGSRRSRGGRALGHGRRRPHERRAARRPGRRGVGALQLPAAPDAGEDVRGAGQKSGAALRLLLQPRGLLLIICVRDQNACVHKKYRCPKSNDDHARTRRGTHSICRKMCLTTHTNTTLSK
jgi:hypothetical protein